VSQPIIRRFGSLSEHQHHDFRASGEAMDYPHIIELNKAFITPLTSGDSLDVTKLLEFATSFVVIDRLTGSGISQGYNQSALR
jgi:hypothetical protein